MPVKYTNNAKLFIKFISIGIVGCALLLFFILYEPDIAIVTHSFPEESSSPTCDARNFIGYVNIDNFAEYIKMTESTRYSMYCLKKWALVSGGFMQIKRVYSCARHAF